MLLMLLMMLIGEMFLRNKTIKKKTQNKIKKKKCLIRLTAFVVNQTFKEKKKKIESDHP